jgi:hypothetical protein
MGRLLRHYRKKGRGNDGKDTAYLQIGSVAKCRKFTPNTMKRGGVLSLIRGDTNCIWKKILLFFKAK